MPRKIPDRWLQYKPCGSVIEGTRIICFKVPLASCYNMPVSSRWTVEGLLNEIPNLGAVIDLTNTKRYYDPQVLLSAGVQHKKIFMEGRVVPPADQVQEFMNTLDTYLQNNNGSLVGVHCTHGLNRTGYMVCRYMTDRLGIQATEAIRRFEKARGYRMERRKLINDILKYSCRAPSQSGTFSDKTAVVPEIPRGK